MTRFEKNDLCTCNQGSSHTKLRSSRITQGGPKYKPSVLVRATEEGHGVGGGVDRRRLCGDRGRDRRGVSTRPGTAGAAGRRESEESLFPRFLRVVCPGSQLGFGLLASRTVGESISVAVSHQVRFSRPGEQMQRL